MHLQHHSLLDSFQRHVINHSLHASTAVQFQSQFLNMSCAGQINDFSAKRKVIRCLENQVKRNQFNQKNTQIKETKITYRNI